MAFNCNTGDVVPVQYSMFYGLTAGTGQDPAPSDYQAQIPAKTAAGTGRFPFPQLGPTSGAGAPTLGGDSASVVIPDIGTYEVSFKVHTLEPGQAGLELQGAELPETCYSNFNPTAGGHPIGGTVLVTTTVVNSVLAVVNPTGNAAALTIPTPAAGGTHATALTITIRRVA